VRAPVHLRPSGVPDTVGPEFPAGTLFAVLGADPTVRRRSPDGRDESVLARVRDTATGQLGWTFLRYTEFAPTCPLRIAREEDLAELGRPLQLRRHLLRGPVPTLHALTPWCRRRADNLEDHTQYLLARADLDGDGHLDRIVNLDDGCAAPGQPADIGSRRMVAVQYRRADGWHGAEALPLYDPLHPTSVATYFVGTVSAGSIAYLVTRWHGEDARYGCCGVPARVDTANATDVLLRLHPDGTMRTVFGYRALLGNDCQLRGLPDEGFEIVCRSPQRRLRLRWDATAFRLVPEGEALPEFAHDGPFCRQRWQYEDQERCLGRRTEG